MDAVFQFCALLGIAWSIGAGLLGIAAAIRDGVAQISAAIKSQGPN